MGVHGDTNIKRRATRLQKGRLRQRVKQRLKQEKKKSFIINDVNLLSHVTIKHKIRCRNSNVSISGKRRHKQLKRLRHSQKDKNKMDVDDSLHKSVPKTKDISMAEPSKQRQGHSSRRKRIRKSKAKLSVDSSDQTTAKDVEMT